MIFQSVVRPLLFRCDPENAHNCLMQVASMAELGLVQNILAKLFKFEDARLNVTVAGIEFPNPVMLAAGFDKNCHAVGLLASLGFGALELGSITARAQPGNPKPRIFRFADDQALINRMGFPSDGVDVVVERLKVARSKYPKIKLGANLGKSKITPNEEALSDYAYSFERVLRFADYVVLNVSSPNTPGLRQLQDKDKLEALIRGLQAINSLGKPIMLKVAPDLTHEQLDEVLETCLNTRISAIIATNTTLGREELSVQTSEAGGLSGRPLFKKALDRVSHLHRQSAGKIPIIGVGGIFSGADAFQMINAGASLVQVYTGLIYRGPGIVREIKQSLVKRIEKRGGDSVSKLIGQEAQKI